LIDDELSIVKVRLLYQAVLRLLQRKLGEMRLRMENVICNLCGIATDTKLVEKFQNGISLVKCRTCGLIYQNPRPSEQELLDYYDGIHPTLNLEASESPVAVRGIEDQSQKINAYVDSRKRFFRRIFRSLAPLLPKQAKVCDLGCGGGMLMDFLRSGDLAETAGYELQGIEPSAAPAKQAQTKGHDVFEGTLEEYNARNDFDLVVMNDVFEHLPDPLRTLISARDRIVPGGYIFIRVPNIDGIILKAWLMRRFQSLRRLQGSNAKGIWSIPDHTYNFSFSLLRQYAEKTGMQIVMKGSVPFEIYSDDLRARVVSILNLLFDAIYALTRHSFNTAIYVVLRNER
jgi:SAM-dependent methyltransferase